MPAGIPASLARQARAALRPLLTHAYSRYTPAATPEWGAAAGADGATTSGLPCLYQSSRRLVARDEGAVVLDVPTLTVYHDDALAVGDRVVSVTDNEGRVLVASAVVSAFDPAAEAGASVFKVAVLGAVEAAP